MLGFEVIYSPTQPIWVPVSSTSTFCHGQLVMYGLDTPDNTGGIELLNDASGLCNTTIHEVPFGVIVGDNNATPTYTTLATALIKTQTITGVDTAAAQLARDYRLAEGMYSKGDPQPLVQVARITPETVLRGYFRNSSTVGTTNITTLSPSVTASTAHTFATFGMTTVANNATVGCVSGGNAGLYRVATSASATAYTYTREWPYTTALTDKYKCVNVRQGLCRMQIDATYSLWIDNTAALTSNAFLVNVLKIDLMGESGTEHCDFQFNVSNFISYTGGRQDDLNT